MRSLITNQYNNHKNRTKYTECSNKDGIEFIVRYMNCKIYK